MADEENVNPIPPNTEELSLPTNDLSFFSDDFNLSDFNIFDDLLLASHTKEFLNSLPIATDLTDSHQFYQNSGDQRSSTEMVCNNTPFPVTSCQAPSDQETSLQSRNKDSGQVLDYPSLEFETPKGDVSESIKFSQGLGECEPNNVCENLNYPSPVSGNYARPASSSSNSVNEPTVEIVDPKMKFEVATNCLLKRKKGTEELNSELRMNKFSRPHDIAICKSPSGIINDNNEKKNARLMRNRESAHLSRHCKNNYYKELEDKVKTMNSTIQNLNYNISYLIAENATLRQQMSGVAIYTPPLAPHGMYPHPSMGHMGYPRAPHPPSVVNPNNLRLKPQQPNPRLKPQQPASAPKTKKAELKKIETKSKKLASVSFIGLLVFILLFGKLIPMVNLKSTFYKESYYPRSKFYDHSVKVLAFKDSGSPPSGMVRRHDFIQRVNCKTSNNEPKEESQPSSKSPDSGLLSNSGKRDGEMALGSSPGEKRRLKPKTTYGKLQQWFKEGLSGPLLSSGTCNEVFQYDTTPVNSASSVVNTSSSSSTGYGHNRRILGRINVIPLSETNNTINNTMKEPNMGMNSNTTMVVSLLVDPLEATNEVNAEGFKTLSRIFVVVLVDSVKYVTYSCILPFKRL